MEETSRVLKRTSFWRFENLWYCNKSSLSLDTDSDTPAIQMFLYSVCDKNIFSEWVALSRNVEIGSAAHQVCFLGFWGYALGASQVTPHHLVPRVIMSAAILPLIINTFMA